MSYSTIDISPIDNSDDRVAYFTLGNIPLVNNLCNSREEALTASRYPLSVNFFKSSKLSALDCAVDSEILFSNYLFKSEVNIPYRQHCKQMLYDIEKYVSIDDSTRIVDIGGNDGTLLAAFKEATTKSVSLLNIEPAENLAQLSISRGVPSLNTFFDADIKNKLEPGVSVITSTNVFQHLKDINSFLLGLKYLLKSDGIWLLEFPYWIHDMETNQFDQVYHEHMYYYTVTPLQQLLDRHDMKIINISKQSIHGGSLRLIITHKEAMHLPDNTIDYFLDYEKQYNLDYYLAWGTKIKLHIENSLKALNDIKNSGKTIAGFGAAAKGCIYLNAMGIDFTTLDYIVDDTDLKQGKYIPGTGIQVVDRSILNVNPPDFILILAHNFSDFIMKSLIEFGYKGNFILLIPQIRVI